MEPVSNNYCTFPVLVRHANGRVQGQQAPPNPQVLLPIPPPPPAPPPPAPSSSPPAPSSSPEANVYVAMSPRRGDPVVADVEVDNGEAIDKLNCELATIDLKKRKAMDIMAKLEVRKRRIEHEISELKTEEYEAWTDRLLYTGRACSLWF